MTRAPSFSALVVFLDFRAQAAEALGKRVHTNL